MSNILAKWSAKAEREFNIYGCWDTDDEAPRKCGYCGQEETSYEFSHDRFGNLCCDDCLKAAEETGDRYETC